MSAMLRRTTQGYALLLQTTRLPFAALMSEIARCMTAMAFPYRGRLPDHDFNRMLLARYEQKLGMLLRVQTALSGVASTVHTAPIADTILHNMLQRQYVRICRSLHVAYACHAY